jgi:hypothetical protein
MAKKAAAKKAPAKRKPRPKNRVDVAGDKLTKELSQKSSSPWRRFMLVGATAAGLVVSFLGGVYSAGGIEIGPDVPVFVDSLAESHENDRASQVRILREYAGKTFANEPEAQKWLNDQRIAARPTDWIPYTDELGKKADEGPNAVKAFADALESVK